MAKGSASTWGWLVMLAVGAVVLFNELDDGSDLPVVEETGEETGEAAALPAAAGTGYALRPLVNTWPSDAGSAGVAGTDLAALNYYLVMDGSGSMGSDECTDGRPKIEAAVGAVKTFVEAVPGQANLGLAVFDSQGIGERVALGAGNRTAVVEQLDAIQAANATPLRSAISIGIAALTARAQAQLGYGEYHLVVVTDGYAEPAEEDPAGVVAAVLQDTPIVVHVIGFCIGEAHMLNQPGRTLYTAADSTDALRVGLSAVLAESPEFDATAFPAL